MLDSQNVRSVNFDRVMRGYRCEDVDDYLKQVADSMDSMAAENEELRQKLMVLAQRIDQYRADSDSVSTAMINAQRLGDNVIKEAKQKAAEIIRDATVRAEAREQRNRGEVELARQEIKTLKREANAFKKHLMDVYREHIELITRMPEYREDPEQPEKAPAPAPEPPREEPPAPAPMPEPSAAPTPEPAAPAPEPPHETPEPAYPVYDEPTVYYNTEEAPAPAPQEQKPEEPDAASTENKKKKRDTVEFAFAPRTRTHGAAEMEEDDEMPSVAALYSETPPRPKRTTTRPRAATRNSPPRAGASAQSRKPKPPAPAASASAAEPDAFEDLDYDV